MRITLLALLGWLAISTSQPTDDRPSLGPPNVAFVVMTHKRPAQMAQLLYNLTESSFVATLRAAGFTSSIVIAESCGTCHRETLMQSKAAIQFLGERLHESFQSVDHILSRDFRRAEMPRAPPKLLSRSASKLNAAMNLYAGLTCAMTGRAAETAVVLEDDIILASDYAQVLVRMLQAREPAPQQPEHSTSNTSNLCTSTPVKGQVQDVHVDPNFIFDLKFAEFVDAVVAQAASRAVASTSGHAGSMGLKWRPSLALGNTDWQAETAMLPHTQHASLTESVFVTPRVVFRVLGWHVSRQLWRSGLAEQLLSSAVWQPQLPAAAAAAVEKALSATKKKSPSMRSSAPAAVGALEALPGVDFVLQSDSELTVGLAPAALEWAEKAQWPGFAECLFCDNYCHDHVVEEAVRGGRVLTPLLPRVSQRAGVVGMSEDTSLDELPAAGANREIAKPMEDVRWLSSLLPVPGQSSWNVVGALRMGCHVTLRMEAVQTTADDKPVGQGEDADAVLAHAQLEQLWAHLVLPVKQESFHVACQAHTLPAALLSMPLVQCTAVALPLILIGLLLCCFNRKLAFCWRCRWALNGWMTAKPKRG